MKNVILQRVLQKTSAFIFGVFFAVLLIEAGLRVQRIFIENRISPKVAVNGNMILCIGDSFVWGQGADRAHSYPRQLEQLLGGRYRVNNAGVRGQNTSQLLSRLEYLLDNYRPEIVVILTGSANFWNYDRYDIHMRDQSILYRLRGYVYKSSVYKLLKLLCADWSLRLIDDGVSKKNKMLGHVENNIKYENFGWEYLMKGEHKKAADYFHSELRSGIASPRTYCGLGTICNDEKKYREAIAYYIKAVEIDPSFIDTYVYAGACCMNQLKFAEAVEWYKRGILASPESKDNSNYGLMIKAANESYDQNLNINVLKFLRDLPRAIEESNPLLQSSIALLDSKARSNSDSAIQCWVEQDIKKMIEMCRIKNIKILLMNYPDRFNKINDILKKTAQECSVVFVDNQLKFAALGGGKGKYFVPDNHCNANGYRVIAENVCETLHRYVFK